jgi:hypothetical protein
VVCFLRSRELPDTLVELLIELVQRRGARAERRVEKERRDDLKRVRGKTGLLLRVAAAARGQPEGVGKEVVFPVLTEAPLRARVKEWKATGPVSRTRVQTVRRSASRTPSRRRRPRLLQPLSLPFQQYEPSAGDSGPGTPEDVCPEYHSSLSLDGMRPVGWQRPCTLA